MRLSPKLELMCNSVRMSDTLQTCRAIRTMLYTFRFGPHRQCWTKDEWMKISEHLFATLADLFLWRRALQSDVGRSEHR